MHRFVFLPLLFLTMWSSAQDTSLVNVDELAEEIMQTKEGNDELKMLFWLPLEYWEAVTKGTPDYSPEAISLLEGILRDYIVVLAVDGKIDTKSTFKTKEQVRRGLRFIYDGDKVLLPLLDSEVSADAKELLKEMQPMFESTMGAMGKGFHVFYFAVPKGKSFSAKEAGAFAIQVGGTDFNWSLPLASFSPRKLCPVDGKR
ncbi:MAG: hypothetical protein JWP69_195 [Flaviaesturariibacter sp.]|nr:hypothetical protein [Flaviaesturariibacter sp.]